MIDRDQLARAMALLVADGETAEESVKAYNAARYAARMWAMHFLPESGQEILNPLLDLEHAQPQLAEQMRTMIDQRRISKGRTPHWTKIGFDTNAYQRDYMDRKRRRQRRASEIENLQRSATEQLIGNARLDFENRIHAQWMEGLNEALENAKAAAALVGNKLTREQQRLLRDAYWDKIEAQLDVAEAAARRKNQGLT